MLSWGVLVKAPKFSAYLASKSALDTFSRIAGRELLADNDPQKPVVMAYKTAFEKATNTPVSTFGGYAHDALRILVDAAGRAKSTKPADLRDAIEKTSGLVGTTGTVTMSAPMRAAWTTCCGPRMDAENNQSPSFCKFRDGLRRLVA